VPTTTTDERDRADGLAALGRAGAASRAGGPNNEAPQTKEKSMLAGQTMEKLVGMRLHGMATALREWLEQPKDKALAPADLVGLLADAEWVHRENAKLKARLKSARLKQAACIEDIDYEHARGLSKAVMLDLAMSRWVLGKQNVILTGKTGVGKSYLACALGNKACRDGFTAAYRRTSRLFDELAQARADGTYPLLLRRLAKTQVLILDDFGLELLGTAQRKELLEVLDDPRHGVSSTIVTSQLEPKEWHAIIGDETIADSVCDRLVNKAHRIKLSGESLRKTKS
jgi:DNA replication protein DnaC